jgi:hypothetical protein
MEQNKGSKSEDDFWHRMEDNINCANKFEVVKNY